METQQQTQQQHKVNENKVLRKLKKNANSKFVSMKSKYCALDLAGKLDDKKIVIEVKERFTPIDYGESSGWVIEAKKIKGIIAELVQRGIALAEVILLYLVTWKNMTYLFDIKAINTYPSEQKMSKHTVFNEHGEVKVDKSVYYLHNKNCLLRKYNTTIEDLIPIFN